MTEESSNTREEAVKALEMQETKKMREVINMAIRMGAKADLENSVRRRIEILLEPKYRVVVNID